jgi:hypothetical protein
MGLTGTGWYEDRVTSDQKVGGSSPSGCLCVVRLNLPGSLKTQMAFGR